MISPKPHPNYTTMPPHGAWNYLFPAAGRSLADLKYLHVECPVWDADAVAGLARCCPALGELHAHIRGAAGVAALKPLAASLHTLYLNHFSVGHMADDHLEDTCEAIRAVAALTSLGELNLSVHEGGWLGLPVLRPLTELKLLWECTLSGNFHPRIREDMFFVSEVRGRSVVGGVTAAAGCFVLTAFVLSHLQSMQPTHSRLWLANPT